VKAHCSISQNKFSYSLHSFISIWSQYLNRFLFGERALNKLFVTKREEMAGDWRRLHNEELYNLYASPNIISAIKSTRMGWAGHVARMGDMRSACNIWLGNLKGRDHSEVLGIDWKIILK
jgi:hypothetical protein